MKKLLTSAVLSCSLIGLLVPTIALASNGGGSTQPRVVFGTICSYTAGASVTIGLDCTSPSTTTVALGKHMLLVYKGTTSPAPQPVSGDSSAAFVWYNKKGAPVAWKLEYSETTFAYDRDLYPGTYVGSTGTCSGGTLSLQGLGSKGTEHTFVTDGNTIYLNSGDASSCAVVMGAYSNGEPLLVWGNSLTDGTIYAFRINANPSGSHRNPFNDEHIIYGTICAYTPGVSVVISQTCGGPNQVLVNLDNHTWIVYRGSTTPAPAPAVGDQAAAYLRWVNNFATAGELAYSDTGPFAFARGFFAGKYVSSTGNCTAGSLTIQDLGTSNNTTFNFDLNTIFEIHGAASTCAAVSGGFTAGEPFAVLASQITDGSWYATRINARPAIGHGHPGHNVRVVFGTICAYSASSVTISQNCGSPSDITVKIAKNAKLVYEGTQSPAPAPVQGDAAAAFIVWRSHTAVTWKLEYGENPFAFATSRFLGSYVSSTGTCSSGTLTIQNLAGKNQTNFNADAYTVYLNAHKASTCAAVTGAYVTGESLRVNANAMTDDSWYATLIDANVTHK